MCAVWAVWVSTPKLSVPRRISARGWTWPLSSPGGGAAQRSQILACIWLARVVFWLQCIMYLVSESWSGSKFLLVYGHHGPCFRCGASCVWRVSRGLSQILACIWVARAVFGCGASCVWRVSRGLALNSRFCLVSTGRVLAAVHHVSGEWVVVWL